MTTFASSASKAGITILINRFYYSTSFTVDFETGEVTNSKGLVSGVKVIRKKNRYLFVSI
jgi:hypothetical protein